MDTNVLYSALRSRLGASFQILDQWERGAWTLVVSNTTVTEYHEVLLREAPALGWLPTRIGTLLDAICKRAERWGLGPRGANILPDPDDLPFLQLAVESGESVPMWLMPWPLAAIR